MGWPKITRLYLHGADEDFYEEGKELGLKGNAIDTFSNWAYEVGFDVAVYKDGTVKVLSCDLMESPNDD